MVRPLSNLNLALNRAQAAQASGAPFNPGENSNLTCWLDAQERTGWTMSTNDVITAVTETGSTPTFDSGSGQRPTIVSVNSLDMMEFAANDYLLGVTGLAALHPGDGDFTIVAVYRSAATSRGMIWWKNDTSVGSGRRFLLRIAANGSDIEWSIDDDTTAQTLVANDVDFANDDIYVVFAIRRGDDLEFYYGNGGSLSTSAASPFSMPASYGSIGVGQSLIGAETQVGPTQDLNGEIGELFFYNGEALDGASRSQLYDYLVSKWDL